MVWIVILLSLAMWGCESQPLEPELTPKAEDRILTESFSSELETSYLPSGERAAVSRDSLLRSILPLLVGDPAKRELERWYEIRGRWEGFFVDLNGLSYCIIKMAREMQEEEPVGAAKLYLSSGRLCNLEGDHLRSTKYNQLAYDIAREHGDSMVMGWSLAHLATPLVFSKDSASAMSYLNRAMQIAESTDNGGLKAGVYIRQGAAHAHVGDFQGLMLYNEKALQIARSNNLADLASNALANIAFSYNNMNRPRESIRLIQDNFERLDSDFTIFAAMANFIVYGAQLALKDFSGAEASINRTCVVSDSLGFFLGLNYCKSGLAPLYEAQGDMERALYYSNAFYAFREERLSSEAQSNMRALQLQHLERQQAWEIDQLRQSERQLALEQKVRRNKILGLVVGGAIFIIFILTLILVRSKLEDARRRKELAELRLSTLRAQMNPHFMFNAINGIQNHILKANKIEAYGYLGKFADLLRMITKTGAGDRISLEGEVVFLTTYLDLEKLRFRDDFDFTVTVAPELTDMEEEIPSMMIQPFVENAILHGLSVLSYPGELSITFTAQQDGVRCVVRDNGRGRVAGGAISGMRPANHLSITEKNTRERMQSLRESGYKNAALKTNDLYEGERAVGTEVVLSLPFLKTEKVSHGDN